MNSRLIKEITDVLENSVEIDQHAEVLAALRRAQELLARVAPYIRNKAMADEARLTASLIEGFFWNVKNDPEDFYKLNQRRYLKSTGVIK